MKTVSKTKLFGLALLVSCSGLSAANWLMLQGTEAEYISPDGVKKLNNNKTPKVWGFIQANYKSDLGSVQINPAGINQTPFSLLNPDLSDQSGFNIARARLAVRGMADNDNKINYFVMTDFANNGINNLAGHDTSSYLTDASVTLKHVPYAKLRVGRFKYPGSEEGNQAVFFSPYIDFTTMSNQQLLERQVKLVGTAQTGAKAGGAKTTHYTSTEVTEPIGAYRDTGAQVFDTVNINDSWALTYAYMYGNGTGISNSSSDSQATHYGYLALEESFGGGKGYYTNSMKFYVWGQTGKRKFVSAGTTPLEADRNRYGLGATYYNHGLRLEAEYIYAEGMIYTGAKDTYTNPLAEDWQLQFAVGKENKAEGGYINAQYEIIPKKLEVFGRFDYSDRLSNDEKGQRVFKTTTLGASYRFKGPTRIDFNYLFRDIDAPGNANAQQVLDNVGDRVQLQVTAVF